MGCSAASLAYCLIRYSIGQSTFPDWRTADVDDEELQRATDAQISAMSVLHNNREGSEVGAGTYKKLSYCWETVRRESMLRISEMDVEMTT